MLSIVGGDPIDHNKLDDSDNNTKKLIQYLCAPVCTPRDGALLCQKAIFKT